MARVGVVGIGFMGWIHYLAYRKVRGLDLAAIHTRSPKKLQGDWRGIKGNFGPSGEVVDLKNIAAYETYEAMLADDSLDLIDICLAPNQHFEFALAALKAGKHVLIEKPITLEVAQAKKLQQEAAKRNLQLLTAHVLPFFTEFNYLLKVAREGKFGKLLGGNFRRVISNPTWIPDFFDPNKVGGPLLDLHIHDAHLIRLLFGMPSGVNSVGRMRGEVVEYCTTLFEFPTENYAVTATTGVLNQPARAFAHGFEVHFEKATLMYDFAVIDDEPRLIMPLTVMPAKGKSKVPKLKAGDPVDAFVQELKEVNASLESGQTSDILGGDLAVDALVLCHKQAESVAKGRRIKV